MANYKGLGIVFTRNLIQEKNPALQAVLLSRLTDQEKELYLHTLTSVWVPISAAQRIIEQAVPLLFPNEKNPFEKYGEMRAQYNLTGVYKAMLRVATVEFVMTQAAKLWSVSYDEGYATAVKDPLLKQGIYRVLEYPAFPECFRRIMTGFITGTMRLTSAKDVVVIHDSTLARQWKWNVQWK